MTNFGAERVALSDVLSVHTFEDEETELLYDDFCHGTAPEEDPEKLRKNRNQLILATVLCTFFMIAEVIGGYMAGSLAIMTDAAHLLSDVAGFLISLFAIWLAQRPASGHMSFGFHRAEILGAIASVLLIWALTGVLLFEAVQRVLNPRDVDGKTMFIVATLGLVVNVMFVFFHSVFTYRLIS